MSVVELSAQPFVITLEMECEICCHGSMVRQPDGVEARFHSFDALLVLLEGMGGRRWWQANQAQIEERFRALVGRRG